MRLVLGCSGIVRYHRDALVRSCVPSADRVVLDQVRVESVRVIGHHSKSENENQGLQHADQAHGFPDPAPGRAGALSDGPFPLPGGVVEEDHQEQQHQLGNPSNHKHESVADVGVLGQPPAQQRPQQTPRREHQLAIGLQPPHLGPGFILDVLHDQGIAHHADENLPHGSAELLQRQQGERDGIPHDPHGHPRRPLQCEAHDQVRQPALAADRHDIREKSGENLEVPGQSRNHPTQKGLVRRVDVRPVNQPLPPGGNLEVVGDADSKVQPGQQDSHLRIHSIGPRCLCQGWTRQQGLPQRHPPGPFLHLSPGQASGRPLQIRRGHPGCRRAGLRSRAAV
mmetsp:Transcript_22846/g.58440  ORF Transcript_22846/g.58440 Transcript_22846/m.58440 type:complete len:339 (-) Transcript_22846:66-1082(-)